MASVKNVNTDYTLNCGTPAGNGTFTVNAQTVFTGNVTYNVPATTVSPFITVAANNTGAITDMGLLAQKGATTFAGLRFDVAANAWQISSAVYSNGSPIASYANIVTGATSPAAGSNTQVQFNNGGVLGANAGLTYNYATSQLTLSGTEALVNYGNTPPVLVANTTLLYSNPIGSGGSGLYFVSTGASDELVSKAKAIVYGIIF